MVNSFCWGSRSSSKKGIHQAFWDKLCVPKKHSGTGFRNLKLFYFSDVGQAMLASFFPSEFSSIVEFTKPNTIQIGICNHSFIWRSVLAALNLYFKVLCQRLRDGNCIRDFVDPWLPNDDNFFVEFEALSGSKNLFVKDLLNNDGLSWNSSLVEGLLVPRDAMQILSIFLSISKPLNQPI